MKSSRSLMFRLKLDSEKKRKQSAEITEVLFLVSDTLFIKKLTIWDLLNLSKCPNQSELCFKTKNKTLVLDGHTKILDKTIDGNEYQLVQRQSLHDAFEEIGIDLTLEQKMILKELLPPILNDYIDVRNLIELFEDLGLHEDIKTEGLKNLRGPGIRQLNKIVNYCKSKRIEFEDFIPEEYLETIIVVSKKKDHEIKVVHSSKLAKFLAGYKIIPHGEEIDERLEDWLEISDDYEHFLMVKKLIRALEAVSLHDYFSKINLG